VRFPFDVGYDTGQDKQAERTSIVELYFEDVGSHMRPKAKSQLPKDARVVDL